MLSAFFLGWAVLFWFATLLSYALGFSNVAATTFNIANMLGATSLLLAVLFFMLRLATKPRTASHHETLPQSRLARLANRLPYWLYSSK
jgi:uncharacterized membrane protein YtjA (UPF0391 family)